MPIFDPFAEADKPLVTSAPDHDGDPQLQALTTLAGWRQFATEMPAVPQLLDSTGMAEPGPGQAGRLRRRPDRPPLPAARSCRPPPSGMSSPPGGG